MPQRHLDEREARAQDRSLENATQSNRDALMVLDEEFERVLLEIRQGRAVQWVLVDDAVLDHNESLAQRLSQLMVTRSDLIREARYLNAQRLGGR